MNDARLDGAPIFEIVLDRAVERGDILQWIRNDDGKKYAIIVASSPGSRVLNYTVDQMVPFCDGLMLGGGS